MKSGEHALWDAYVATAPARAYLSSFRDLMVELSVAFKRAFDSLRPTVLAAGASIRRIAEQLEKVD